jgi:hypothetical protein
LEPALGLNYKIDSEEVVESSQNLTTCRPKVEQKAGTRVKIKGDLEYHHVIVTGSAQGLQLASTCTLPSLTLAKVRLQKKGGSKIAAC